MNREEIIKCITVVDQSDEGCSMPLDEWLKLQAEKGSAMDMTNIAFSQIPDLPINAYWIFIRTDSIGVDVDETGKLKTMPKEPWREPHGMAFFNLGLYHSKTAHPSDGLEKIETLPNGANIYKNQCKQSGGDLYWTDAIGGGAVIVNTALTNPEELSVVLKDMRKKEGSKSSGFLDFMRLGSLAQQEALVAEAKGEDSVLCEKHYRKAAFLKAIGVIQNRNSSYLGLMKEDLRNTSIKGACDWISEEIGRFLD